VYGRSCGLAIRRSLVHGAHNHRVIVLIGLQTCDGIACIVSKLSIQYLNQ